MTITRTIDALNAAHSQPPMINLDGLGHVDAWVSFDGDTDGYHPVVTLMQCFPNEANQKVRLYDTDLIVALRDFLLAWFPVEGE